MLCNDDATKKDKEHFRKVVHRTVLPALGHMSSHMQRAATELAPIPGTNYAHRRERTELKKDAQATAMKRNETIEVIMLQGYVKKYDKADSLSQNVVTPPKKLSLSRAAKNIQLPLTIRPPKPSNGNVYGKTEFCEIVTKFPKASQQRALMIQKIVDMKYVTQHVKSLHRHIRQYESFEHGESFVNDEMRGPGAPPILNNQELNKSLAQLGEQNGKAMDSDGMMTQLLVDSKRRKLDNAGFCAIGEHVKISRKTATNYMAFCAGKPGFHLAASTIIKTTARYASENSYRCVFTYFLVVMSTHFVEVPEEDMNIRKLVQQLSPEEQQMYILASQCRGGRAVRPIPRRNLGI